MRRIGLSLSLLLLIAGCQRHEDRGIPVADVKAFGQALTKAGKLADIRIFEDVGHGFMSEEAAATRDAWRRIDGFFANTLRVNMPNP